MPYPQDLVGKFIRYTDFRDTGVIASPNAIKTDATAACSASVLSGAPGGSGFKDAGAPWNFTFLRYAPGAVSVAPITSFVLTGPMSGCYLIRYMDGGRQMLAHVGTYLGAGDAATKRAKDAWAHLLARPGVRPEVGGDPFDEFSTSELTQAFTKEKQGTLAPPQVMGCWTPAGAYALLVAVAQPALQAPSPMTKVLAVKPMTLSQWSKISRTPKFA